MGLYIPFCSWRKASARSLSAGISLWHCVPSRAVLGQCRSAADKQASLAGMWKEESACLVNAFPKDSFSGCVCGA